MSARVSRLTLRTSGGRHRFGATGLRYCRDYPDVRARLERSPDTQRHRRTEGMSAGMLMITVAVAAAALLVTGWITAGPAAVAGIIK